MILLDINWTNVVFTAFPLIIIIIIICGFFFLKHHDYKVEKEYIPLSSSAFIFAKLALFAKMNGVTA